MLDYTWVIDQTIFEDFEEDQDALCYMELKYWVNFTDEFIKVFNYKPDEEPLQEHGR